LRMTRMDQDKLWMVGILPHGQSLSVDGGQRIIKRTPAPTTGVRFAKHPLTGYSAKV